MNTIFDSNLNQAFNCVLHANAYRVPARIFTILSKWYIQQIDPVPVYFACMPVTVFTGIYISNPVKYWHMLVKGNFRTFTLGTKKSCLIQVTWPTLVLTQNPKLFEGFFKNNKILRPIVFEYSFSVYLVLFSVCFSGYILYFFMTLKHFHMKYGILTLKKVLRKQKKKEEK